MHVLSQKKICELSKDFPREKRAHWRILQFSADCLGVTVVKIANTITLLIAVLIGAVILFKAVPQTIDAFSRLPTASVSKQIIQKNSPSEEGLKKLHNAQRSIIERRSPGSGYSEMAITEMAMAKNAPVNSVKQIKLYKRAEISVEQGLLSAPADPYAWARLAFLRLKNKGVDSDAHQALMMSILTGPREKRLVLVRVNYALLVWDNLSLPERAIIRNQILWAERVSRKHLLALAQGNRNYRRIILNALVQDSDQFNSFFRALQRQKKKGAVPKAPHTNPRNE